jgi:anti-sigma28 factor (negative regulator of flagellin synthesis)
MRIDDLNRTPLTQGTEKTDQAAEKRALEKNNITDSADQAEVSQLAQALSGGDTTRLEQLRMQVQSGNYEVSGATLAKSIINAHFKE